MSNRPLVTAIITTCARPKLIGRAIDSVYAQSYSPIECVVVNDGADDETRSVLAAKLAAYPGLRTFANESVRGLSAARNIGMANARGEFIAFLDDDDVWLPSKIERQVERMMQAGLACGLIYTWFEIHRGDEVESARCPMLEGRIFRHLIVSQPLGNGSTLLIRKAAADSVGEFDTALLRGIDGDFIRRLAVEWDIAGVQEVLTWLYVGHEYERITTDNESGLRRALSAHEAKFSKFPTLATEYPLEAARLMSVIAQHKAKLGEPREALRWGVKALRQRPLSPSVWRGLASTAKLFVVAK